MDCERTEEALNAVRDCIPSLDATKRKGQSGRLAIVGGCLEYTGAPYFAAISSLRAGADLCHVFCGRSASNVIKSYSPELIVHPYMPDDLVEAEDSLSERTTTSEQVLESYVERCATRVNEWISRFDCVVVGPGLGRSKTMLSTTRRIIDHARCAGVPLVIDADGLYLLCDDLDLVSGYEKAILTPNASELLRLSRASGLDTEDLGAARRQVSARMNGATILSKGSYDAICRLDMEAFCRSEGSPRRAGGQGDVLAGIAGTISSWMHREDVRSKHPISPAWSTSCASSRVAREASRLAFERRGRSHNAEDVSEEVGNAMESIFGTRWSRAEA